MPQGNCSNGCGRTHQGRETCPLKAADAYNKLDAGVARRFCYVASYYIFCGQQPYAQRNTVTQQTSHRYFIQWRSSIRGHTQIKKQGSPHTVWELATTPVIITTFEEGEALELHAQCSKILEENKSQSG